MCDLARDLNRELGLGRLALAAADRESGVQEARALSRHESSPARPPWSCNCRCPSRKAHRIKRGTRPDFARGMAVVTALGLLYAAAHGFPYLIPLAVTLILLIRVWRGPR
jgi:hypothetical protein